MTKQDPDRWRELAQQATKEQNPEKLMELAKQIEEILNEDDDSRHKPLSNSVA